MNPVRDSHLFVCGQRHAIFVNGERDHRRAIALGHRQHLRRAIFSVLQIDRVDNRLARNALQRLFDNIGFGGIHKNRCGNTGGDLFQDRSDVIFLVFSDNRTAQVEHVRTVVHQLFGKR